ncbi:MAG TPA: LysR substrate-binding domain-containing protein [Stellaceae bacterium]|jgi:LysR family hydrogen peroxide-inducible transcriptional activator
MTLPLPSLRQLRYLVALAEHGHFGRAADACAVTQSTFSAGIQELESTLGGVSLVERSKRRVLVTPLGHDVVARARRILREAEDLAEAVRTARAPLSGPLRLGVIPTVGPYLLPRIMPRLRENFPGLQLYVREEQTAGLIEKLTGGRLDLLLIAKPYDLGEAVETMEVGEDELLVACPAGHRLTAESSVAGHLLRAEPLLLLEDGHCLRSQALAACDLAPADRNEVFQGTSLRTLVQMVAAGLGCTLIPRMALEAEAPVGTAETTVAVRPLGPGRHARTIALAWRRTSGRKDEFRQFGAFIAEAIP